MKTAWTTGLSKEEAEKVRIDFSASTSTRKRLTTLINNKINSNNKKRVSCSSYDTPNWSLLQADSIGYERALIEILSLLE